MNIRQPLLIAVCTLTGALCATARGSIVSPDAEGFLVRGSTLAAAGDYRASIDQLTLIGEPDALGYDDRERAAWLRAEATYLDTDGSIAAEELFRTFLNEYPASPLRHQAAMRVADCLFARALYARALEIYDAVAPEALTADCREQLDYRRAYSLLQLGRRSEAAEAFSRAANAGTPTGNAARFYAGYIAYSEGDYALARKYFDRVNTDTRPGSDAAYYLAQIEFAQGNYSKALSAARNLLRRSAAPDEFTAEARRIAGESLYRLGDRDAAADYLAPYIAASEKPALSSLYIMGVYKYGLGNYSEAVTLLTPVSTRRPVDASAQSAYLYIGQALYRNGDRDAAMIAFDKAMNADADHDVAEAAAYNYIAASLEGANPMPFSSISETLGNFLKRYPDGPYSDSVRRYLADSYLADRDYARALDVLDRISAPGPAVRAARHRALYALAWQKITAGEHAAALPLLDRATKESGSDRTIAAEIKFLRGEALLGSGMHARAAEALGEYLHDSNAAPDNRFNTLYDLGYARMGIKEYAAAEKAFADALKHAPATLDPGIRADLDNRRADIAYYDSRFADAERLYDSAATIAPDAADYAVYRSALMKGYLRRHTDKVEALQDFRRRFPASPLMPEALLELTASYIQLGRDDDALAVYNLLTEKYPATAQGRQAALQMALTLLNAGRRDSAIEAYRRVVELYPESDEAVMARSFLANLGEDIPAIKPADGSSATTPVAAPVIDDSTGDNAVATAAQAAFDAGDAQKALGLWQRLEAQASDPATTARARMGIVRAARDMDDYPTILSATEAILSSSATGSADICEATFSRALALAETGHEEEARSLWTSAAAGSTDIYGAKSAIYLAESLAAAGQTDRAMRVASDLVASGTPHAYWLARGFIIISDLYAAQGKKFEAREYLDALRQNYPGTETDIFMMIEERLKQ